MNAPGMIHHFAEAILESAIRQGLDENLLLGDEGRKSQWEGEDLRRFLTSVANATQDEFYGLTSSPCPIGSSQFGLELLTMNETLGKALERCCRFYAVITNGLTFRLSKQGNSAVLEMELADPSRDRNHFLIEWHVTRWNMLLQWLIGKEFVFDRIEFSHAPQVALSEYYRIFGNNCRFNQPKCQMAFPFTYLQRRVIRTPEDLEASKDYRGYNPMWLGDVKRKWRILLRQTIVARLADMEPIPTLEEVAAGFNICSQTLRRRLKAEGTSYRAVKAEARREMVLDSITDDEISLGQVSLMAGFAEPNGLVRVMKSWTGLNPSQFRRATVTEYGRHSNVSCGGSRTV